MNLLNSAAKVYLKRHKILVQCGEESVVSLWRVMGKKHATLEIGSCSMVTNRICFERENAIVTVGNRTFIGGSGLFSVAQRVAIGNDVLLSWGVTITDHSSHSHRFSERSEDVVRHLRGKKSWAYVTVSPVVICDKAWIGFNSSILRGVSIGEGAIVGANSTVTRDVPPWVVVAGNPARTIREISPADR